MDFEKLKEKTSEEIKEHLLNSVMKSEKEIEREEVEKKSKSDLKIFLVKSLELHPEDLPKSIDEVLDSEEIGHNFKKFLKEHKFIVTEINENIYGLRIHTPEFKKEDDFILYIGDGYWHIWTLARRYWTKKTVEKLIDHHPLLERSFINPEELEDITSKNLRKEMEEKSHFSGFVAKYKPFYSEKQVSINMYGGTYEDLETVKDEFQAEPTQITITMKNSPVNCVLGNLHGNEGFISLSTILEGYFDWGKKIADVASDLFERSDKESFEMKNPPVEMEEEKNGLQYIRYKSHHAFTLEPQFDKNKEEIDKLFEKTLEWLLEKKQGFYGYKWDEDSYHLLKKENMDSFQLSKQEKDLILYPLEGCSEKTVKNVCKDISENVFSDLGVKRYSSEPAVGT